MARSQGLLGTPVVGPRTHDLSVRQVEFGPFRLDARRRELRRGTELLALTPRVFDTLLALLERRDRVAGKRELMATLWPDRVVEEANLAQNVFTLRKLLGDGPHGRPYIATIPRYGYRFVGVVREVDGGGEPVPPAVRKAGTGRRRWIVSAGAVAVAITLATAGPLPPRRADARRRAVQPIQSLAVLPIENLTGDAARVRITVQLVEGRTDRHLWAQTYERQLEEVLAAQADVPRAIALELERALGPARTSRP